MKKIIILDSNALIHRSYHALPPFKTKKGQLVNALYGFIAVLIKVIRELEPDYLVATFDMAGPTFRDLEYKEYKAKRIKASQELYDQIPLVKEILKAFDIPVYEKKGFEADDVIGTITKIINKKKGIKSIIITGDLDTLQLVNSNTEVLALKKGIKETITYNKKAIMERYGLTPKQIIDLKGLRGDPSDNIPGVTGIGEKTALELIKKFGSIKELYQELEKSNLNPKLKARLLEYKEQALFSQYLATIRKDAPINFSLKDALWKLKSRKKVINLFKKFEFNSLIKRLDMI